VELQNAQQQLDDAQTSTASIAFAPGASQLLAAPSYSGGYVFPVGGGAGVVSVGRTHHDYPAANIDAPEGSPEYALHDGTVDNAWDAAAGGKCGIGFTISTTDGLTWTYCHMASLDPTVVAGAQLAAGQPVGLVGQTGDATGPNLHLQLQPATGYPQDEPWFEAFAGTAFSWADWVQERAAPQVVFAVIGGDSRSLESAAQPVVYFSTN
jgi:murein DD-endopeptidase MepM/ murein hydrolase activator NlpD